MRLLSWRKKGASDGLTEARRQRAEAERRLASEHEHVVIPLRELRKKNHVGEAITMLITSTRAAQDGSDG
jgi:hypothetical protein